MQSTTNDHDHINYLDDGALIDLYCPDDAVKTPDHSVGFLATVTEGHNKDPPIPFDLSWDDTSHQSFPGFFSADSLPSSFSILSPTAPVYVPKSLSPRFNAETHGAPAYQPQPTRTSLKYSISTSDNGRPSTPQKPQFKTYADASNYFYSSNDHTVLETPLSSHTETLPAPSVPAPHRKSSESFNQPVEQEKHVSSRPNWAVVSAPRQDQPTHHKDKPPTIPGARIVSRTLYHDFSLSETPQHPLPICPPRDDGQPAVHSLSNSNVLHFSKPLDPPVQTFKRTHVAGDAWDGELPSAWSHKSRGDDQNPPSRSSPANDQFAEATKVSQPFYPHQIEVPQLTILSQPCQLGGSRSDDQFGYKASGALSDDRSGPQHHKQHLIPSHQKDIAPKAKDFAPLDVWESSYSSAFELPVPGAPGWGRPIAHQRPPFGYLPTGEHDWVSSDEPAWNAPEDFVEIPNRQLHPLPASLRPRLPVSVFSKRTSRDPNLVGPTSPPPPSPNEESPLDTTRLYPDPEWSSYHDKKGRPLRLPDFQ